MTIKLLSVINLVNAANEKLAITIISLLKSFLLKGDW